MSKKIACVGTIGVFLTSCGSFTPPPPETEITLRDALLDTTGSLAAMKADLIAKDRTLGMYVDDVTVEFYVKGSRQTVLKQESEVNVTPPGFAKSLVIKPSYTATADGERQNKITIKFKNNVTLTAEQRALIEGCRRDPNCLSVLKRIEKKQLLPK